LVIEVFHGLCTGLNIPSRTFSVIMLASVMVIYI
jgi:hypothetical protein